MLPEIISFSEYDYYDLIATVRSGENKNYKLISAQNLDETDYGYNDWEIIMRRISDNKDFVGYCAIDHNKCYQFYGPTKIVELNENFRF